MAFKKTNLDNWVTQEKRSDNTGFEQFVTLRLGDHPFKITEQSSDAPPLVFPSINMPANYINEFNLVLKVSPGYIYDLNRFFPNVKIPLYVSKRRDGTIVAVQGRNRLSLTTQNWESMKVTPTIESSYTLRIKTKGGIVQEGSGMLFMVCVFRDVSTIVGNLSSRIDRASILTDTQLKAKYPGTVVDRFGATLPERYRNTVRVIVLYSPENSRYVATNAATFSFTKGLPIPGPETYSEELKRQLELESQNLGGPFNFIFKNYPSGFPVLRNDLFLRIY